MPSAPVQSRSSAKSRGVANTPSRSGGVARRVRPAAARLDEPKAQPRVQAASRLAPAPENPRSRPASPRTTSSTETRSSPTPTHGKKKRPSRARFIYGSEERAAPECCRETAYTPVSRSENDLQHDPEVLIAGIETRLNSSSRKADATGRSERFGCLDAAPKTPGNHSKSSTPYQRAGVVTSAELAPSCFVELDTSWRLARCKACVHDKSHLGAGQRAPRRRVGGSRPGPRVGLHEG
jgi:hypothetical protein